jgi:hypothetical protein
MNGLETGMREKRKRPEQNKWIKCFFAIEIVKNRYYTAVKAKMGGGHVWKSISGSF